MEFQVVGQRLFASLLLLVCFLHFAATQPLVSNGGLLFHVPCGTRSVYERDAFLPDLGEEPHNVEFLLEDCINSTDTVVVIMVDPSLVEALSVIAQHSRNVEIQIKATKGSVDIANVLVRIENITNEQQSQQQSSRNRRLLHISSCNALRGVSVVAQNIWLGQNNHAFQIGGAIQMVQHLGVSIVNVTFAGTAKLLTLNSITSSLSDCSLHLRSVTLLPNLDVAPNFLVPIGVQIHNITLVENISIVGHIIRCATAGLPNSGQVGVVSVADVGTLKRSSIAIGSLFVESSSSVGGLTASMFFRIENISDLFVSLSDIRAPQLAKFSAIVMQSLALQRSSIVVDSVLVSFAATVGTPELILVALTTVEVSSSTFRLSNTTTTTSQGGGNLMMGVVGLFSISALGGASSLNSVTVLQIDCLASGVAAFLFMTSMTLINALLFESHNVTAVTGFGASVFAVSLSTQISNAEFRFSQSFLEGSQPIAFTTLTAAGNVSVSVVDSVVRLVPSAFSSGTALVELFSVILQTHPFWIQIENVHVIVTQLGGGTLPSCGTPSPTLVNFNSVTFPTTTTTVTTTSEPAALVTLTGVSVLRSDGSISHSMVKLLHLDRPSIDGMLLTPAATLLRIDVQQTELWVVVAADCPIRSALIVLNMSSSISTGGGGGGRPFPVSIRLRNTTMVITPWLGGSWESPITFLLVTHSGAVLPLVSLVMDQVVAVGVTSVVADNGGPSESGGEFVTGLASLSVYCSGWSRHPFSTPLVPVSRALGGKLLRSALEPTTNVQVFPFSAADPAAACPVVDQSTTQTPSFVEPAFLPTKPQLSGAQAASIASALASLAGGGALGGEAAMLSVLALFTCEGESPWSANAAGEQRFVLSLFYDFGPSAAVVGNIGLSLLIFAAQKVAVVIASRKDGRHAQHAADLRFPAMAVTSYWFLLPGVLFAAASLMAANEADQLLGGLAVGQGVVGALAMCIAAAVTVRMVVVASASLWPIVHEFPVDNIFCAPYVPAPLQHLQVGSWLLPRFMWEPRLLRLRFGPMFAAMGSCGALRIHLLLQWHGAVFSLLAAVPFPPSACAVRFALGIAWLCVPVVLIVCWRMALLRRPQSNVCSLLSNLVAAGVLAASFVLTECGAAGHGVCSSATSTRDVLGWCLTVISITHSVLTACSMIVEAIASRRYASASLLSRREKAPPSTWTPRPLAHMEELLGRGGRVESIEHRRARRLQKLVQHITSIRSTIAEREA